MPRRGRGGVRAALQALVLAAFAAGGAASQGARNLEAEIGKGRGELDRLTREIQRAEDRIAKLLGEEKQAASNLEALESAVASAEQLLAAYDRQEARLSRDAERRSAELEATRARVDELRQMLAQHIDRVYRRGKPKLVEVLVGAEDFGAALRRARYVSAVLAAQRELVTRFLAERERLVAELTELEARERDVAALRAAQEADKARLERLSRARANALQSIRNERERHERSVAEMETSSRELEAFIARLEAERRRAAESATGGPFGPRAAFVPSRPFPELKGSLLWPVRGEILNRFGASRHPRYGTQTFSSGVDIRAVEGQEVVAVANGQVELVDWVRGYGKTVILSHGNGYYTLYSHASRILVAPGERVTAGKAVALAGATDSLHGDCVHFEIRQGGQAVDPLPWLSRR
jgi:septal ring factor EnvC (AmiA/AmiB activator)